MKKTIIDYIKNGKAVVHILAGMIVLMTCWLVGLCIDLQKSAAVKAAEQEEERSHVAEFITDNKKMLSTLSKCNTIGISYSSMSSEIATHKNELSYHMLEKLISNTESGEGVRLTLSTNYWKSSGLKCEYSYAHKAELYKLLPED